MRCLVFSQQNSSLDRKLSKNSGTMDGTLISTAGFLTGSNTAIHFTIYITSKDATISSISCTDLRIRQNGSYLIGSSSTYGTFNGTASFYQNYLGTLVTLTFPSSIGGTNNDVVGVTARLTTVFS